MTPLLGTKNPSAPVGDKSGGDRRAARSLLSCALWRGMGRLWRGMGGMGRPEPLSAQRPHQQQGLSGFHKTRNTNHGLYASLPTVSRYFPRFPAISRPPHPPPPIKCPRVVRLSWSAARTAAPRRPVAAFPRAVARYGAVMARHGRRPSPAPATRPFLFTRRQIFLLERTRPPNHGFHETRNTRHESRPLWPFGSPWVHEGWRHKKPPSGPLPPPASHCFPVHHCSRLFTIVRHCSPKNIVLRQFPRAARSLLSCALWRGMGRLWRGMGGRRPPHRQHGLSGFHETRDPRPGFFRITAFLHAREFPYNHWRAAGRSSPACPHGSRRWLDTSPHL